MKFLLLTEAFAVGTFALGWWAVPLLAFLWAVFVGTRSRPVFFATICATAAWCGILLLDAARGPLVAVAERFGGVFGFRPIVLMVVTILFPALLGWSASSVGSAIRGVLSSRQAVSREPTAATQSQTSTGEVAVVDV